jgi:hypothetical protein
LGQNAQNTAGNIGQMQYGTGQNLANVYGTGYNNLANQANNYAGLTANQANNYYGQMANNAYNQGQNMTNLYGNYGNNMSNLQTGQGTTIGQALQSQARQQDANFGGMMNAIANGAKQLANPASGASALSGGGGPSNPGATNTGYHLNYAGTPTQQYQFAQ